MLRTLGEEIDGGDKRMSMWTDEEKRQSLMKTNQDSRVKNKKKVVRRKVLNRKSLWILKHIVADRNLKV